MELNAALCDYDRLNPQPVAALRGRQLTATSGQPSRVNGQPGLCGNMQGKLKTEIGLDCLPS